MKINRYLDDELLQKPSREIANQITKFTQEKINKIINEKSENQITSVSHQLNDKDSVQYIKYITNNAQGAAEERIIQMHQKQVDPLAPNEFKHKKTMPGTGSPPPTILHSPPRQLTAKDKADWNIPPCISNWKNVQGFTIPLEQRIRADGRNLNETTVNEKFGTFSDAMFIAEKQARQEIEERNQLKQQQSLKQHLIQEEIMKEAAQKAKDQKEQLQAKYEKQLENNEEIDLSDVEKTERDQMRYIRKRELEREQRLAAAGNRKTIQVREQERDISEKIALGMVQPTNNQQLFDQRLYNQTSGIDHGFGFDDEYDVYDSALFTDRTQANIYKNVRNVLDEGDEDQNLSKILTKATNKGFEGANENYKKSQRNEPIQFEKDKDNKIFGEGSFINEEPIQKKIKK